MISQNISSNIGESNIETDDRLKYARLIDYLDERLQTFPAFFKKITSAEKITDEVQISFQLCDFLNDYREENKILLFRFYPEIKNKYSEHSSDMSVIEAAANRNPSSPKPACIFFVIEAKRLPTGVNNKGVSDKRREKEYVQGKKGGIQRYKEGHHGKGLPESGMIGYVQKETCKHWHEKINGWINELIRVSKPNGIQWDSDDLLKEADDFGATQKYASQSSRTSKTDSIKLHHYLIELT